MVLEVPTISNPYFYVFKHRKSGGGVLLIDEKTKEMFLGEEYRSLNKRHWSDFGGKKEDCDLNIWETAVREFEEEMYGSLKIEDILKNNKICKIQLYTTYLKNKNSNTLTSYYIFALIGDFNKKKEVYMENFKTAKIYNCNEYVEKIQVAWIKIWKLKNDLSFRIKDVPDLYFRITNKFNGS